jgi:hypothetical protein
VSLEISANTSTWKRCAPFLGVSLLGFEAPSCVLRFVLVEVIFLKNIAKDLCNVPFQIGAPEEEA